MKGIGDTVMKTVKKRGAKKWRKKEIRMTVEKGSRVKKEK